MALTNHWTKVSCRLLVIHFLSTLISHGEAACTELEQMECSNVENSSLLNIYRYFILEREGTPYCCVLIHSKALLCCILLFFK
jgi:hypothetical protein